MKTGVATMVFRERGRDSFELLLLERATEPYHGEWFPVEGGIDTGEAPDRAVLRELQEETQLVPSALFRESVRTVPSTRGPVRLHIYVTFVSLSARVVLNEEHSAYRWCSLTEGARLLSLASQREALERARAGFLDSSPTPHLRVELGSSGERP